MQAAEHSSRAEGCSVHQTQCKENPGWERSARFEGAARFHFARLGWPLDATDRAYVESFSTRTRAALGDAAFERLRAAGGALPFGPG